MGISINIDTKSATDALRNSFAKMPKKDFDKGVYFAINETLTKGKSSLANRIKKEFGQTYLSKSGIKNALPLIKAKSRKWVGKIMITGVKIPLKYWHPKVVTGRGGGVSVEIYKGKRNLIRSAFMPKKQSLNGQVYARGRYSGNKFNFRNKRIVQYPKPDMPITRMVGLALPQVFKDNAAPIVQQVKKEIENDYPIKLQRILNSISEGSFRNSKKPSGLS